MSGQDCSLMGIAKNICSLGHGSISIVADGHVLLDRLAEIHNIDASSTYWWKSLKGARYFRYDESCDSWSKHVVGLLAEMGDPVFIVVTDDDPMPWPILRVEQGEGLICILNEMQFFEYFVFSENCDFIFFDTHDNILISSS